MQKITFPFLLIATVYIILLNTTEFSWLVVVKPLPVLLLTIPVFQTLQGWQRNVAIAALLFSATGDVVIEYMFVAGIGAFLLAQLCYFSLFANQHKQLTHRVSISLLVASFAAIMLWLIYPQVGELLIPIVVYLLVILLMAVAAISSHQPLWPAVIGTLFFIISDAMIAINRFYEPIPLERILIMATYYVAQFLIIQGLTKKAKGG